VVGRCQYFSQEEAHRGRTIHHCEKHDGNECPSVRDRPQPAPLERSGNGIVEGHCTGLK